MRPERKITLLMGACAAVGLGSHVVSAAVIDWKPDAATAGWATGTNWSGNTPPANDTTTDTARFNQTSYTSQPSAGTRSVGGLIVGDGTVSTGALTLAATNLSLGAGGIVVNANAGPTTVGKITSTADQSWINNSSNTVTLSGANVLNSTVTVSGSGAFVISGAHTLNAGIVFSTSGSFVTFGGTNTGTAGITVDGSILLTGNAASFSSSLLTLKGGGIYITAARTYSNELRLEGDLLFGTASNAPTWTGIKTTFGDRIMTFTEAPVGITNNGLNFTVNPWQLGGNLELRSQLGGTDGTRAAMVGFGSGFNLGGADRVITLSMNEGSLTIGQLVLNGNLTFNGSGSLNSTINGGADLGGVNRSITFNNTGAGVPTFSGALSGTPAVLTFKGSSTNAVIGALTGLTAHAVQYDATGSILLAGQNTYTGGTSVTAGTIIMGSAPVLAGTISSGNFGLGSVSLGQGTNAVNLRANATTARRIANNMTIDGDLTFSTSAVSGSIYLDVISSLTTPGTIALTRTNTLTVENTVSAYLIGPISGTGFGINKQGVGTLYIGNNSTLESLPNTFSGLNTFSAGNTAINKVAGVDAIAGDILINGAGTLTHGASNENIKDTASITVAAGGQWLMNGRTETVANVAVNGGTISSASGVLVTTADLAVNSGALSVARVTTGSGGLAMGSGVSVSLSTTNGLTLNGNVTFNGAGDAATLTGSVLLNGTRVFNIADGAADVDLVQSGIIGDGAVVGGGITKTGAGTLSLASNNIFTGTLVISQGRVKIAGGRIADAATVQLDGGTYDLGGTSDVIGSLVLSDNSVLDFGAAPVSLLLSVGTRGTIDTTKTLSLVNWSSGIDSFDLNGPALTVSELATFTFINPEGFAPGNYSAVQSGGGLITPGVMVPEPASLSLVMLGATALLNRRRRRQ